MIVKKQLAELFFCGVKDKAIIERERSRLEDLRESVS